MRTQSFLWLSMVGLSMLVFQLQIVRMCCGKFLMTNYIVTKPLQTMETTSTQQTWEADSNSNDPQNKLQKHNLPVPPQSVTPARIHSMPQTVPRGRYNDQSAYPYISQDIWYELVDNNQTFFIRPQDFTGNNSLSTEEYWIEWLDQAPWPVTLVMNNNLDWSFPHPNIPITTRTLAHLYLQRLFVMNPVIWHHKIMPLSIGYKWQFRSTALYGEDKQALLAVYRNVSTSPATTATLFAAPARTATVWVRPATVRRRFEYKKSNAALATPREAICGILQTNAPHATVCPTEKKLNQTAYFIELQTHRFVTCAAGVGLDTHTTWEALLAGSIPIVPRSALSPVYDLLPVWQVDDWAEVTDEAVQRKSQEFWDRRDTLRWDLAFATGWKELLQNHHHHRSSTGSTSARWT